MDLSLIATLVGLFVLSLLLAPLLLESLERRLLAKPGVPAGVDGP